MVLVNLSGGYDSVYCAWKQLTESQEELLIHHCYMKKKSGRAPYEKSAVDKVLKWFTDNGLTHYKYVETVFNYKTFGIGIHDIELVGCITGVLLQLYPEINKVLFCSNKGDRRGWGNPARVQQSMDLRRLIGLREVDHEFPALEYYKKEIIKLLPKDLAELCFTCRNPGKEGEPCGRCSSCRSAGDRRQIERRMPKWC